MKNQKYINELSLNTENKVYFGSTMKDIRTIKKNKETDIKKI